MRITHASRMMRLAGHVAAALIGAMPVRAEVLELPAPAAAVLEPVVAACPDCREQGFLPCGTSEVQYGAGFASTAMQGALPRAYLLARAPVNDELVPLLGESEDRALIDALHRRFADLLLVVIEGDWRTARVLAPAGDPRIAVDPQQQACFRDPARDLACCLGDGPSGSGCLPKADPPSVRLSFADPESGERLQLRYPIGKGEITLRRSADTGRASLYWCHKWERARLVSGP